MDKKLSAEEMAVGGGQHWDPFVKQIEKDYVVRDSGWSLFFFFISLFSVVLGRGKGKRVGKYGGGVE